MVTHISSEQLRKLVNERKPAVVLFSGEWCGDCVAFKPLWTHWIKRHPGNVYQLELANRDATWDAWEIDEIPTVVAFIGGVEKGRAQGIILEKDLDSLEILLKSA